MGTHVSCIFRGYKPYMGVSENGGTPKSSHFNRDFHYKPSILGYHYFWKHPYVGGLKFKPSFFTGLKSGPLSECYHQSAVNFVHMRRMYGIHTFTMNFS